MVPDGAQNAHCGLCSTSAPGTGYPSLPGSKKRLLLLLHGLPSVLLCSVLLTPPVVPPMGEWGQGGSITLVKKNLYYSIKLEIKHLYYLFLIIRLGQGFWPSITKVIIDRLFCFLFRFCCCYQESTTRG